MDYGARNIFITGGSSGIGLATAKLFSSRGANVAIFARGEKRIADALVEIEAARRSGGQKFTGGTLDVSDNEAVQAVFSQKMGEFGIPDVLVNCAGIAYPNYFEDIPYEKFDQTLKINLYGIRNTVAAAVPHMKKQGGGSIVNISSVAGFVGVFGYTAYSSSKFGIIGFSQCLRGELKPHNITVSVCCPPDTDTPQLHEENKTKPAETRAIAGNAGLLQPAQVAEALVKGMEKGKFMILPGLESKYIYLAQRFIPSIVAMIMDMDVKKVQKAKG
ncbi:MAG: SDR family oxidoreductase [Smithellaceae bacterium]|nr:SDR family oxidoreductase [Smithellaceae bacterium]